MPDGETISFQRLGCRVLEWHFGDDKTITMNGRKISFEVLPG
jgi:hypothetical protein